MTPGGWGTPRREEPVPPPPPPTKERTLQLYAEFAACGFPQPGRLT